MAWLHKLVLSSVRRRTFSHGVGLQRLPSQVVDLRLVEERVLVVDQQRRVVVDDSRFGCAGRVKTMLLLHVLLLGLDPGKLHLMGVLLLRGIGGLLLLCVGRRWLHEVLSVVVLEGVGTCFDSSGVSGWTELVLPRVANG